MKDCKSKDCDYFKLYGKCTNSCIERGLKKTITNYDRIRNMSVDEMAEWFYSIANVKYGCWLPTSCLDSDCKVCIKKWLESEVTE